MCGKKRVKKIERFDAKHASIAQSFYVNPEHCENPQHFEGYIRLNAYGDFRSGMSTTHVMVEYEDGCDDPVCLNGYISLKATSLVIEDNTLSGYPALEISELAVDKKFEGQHYGKALLEYAVRICDELREQIGIKYLLVCAEKNAESYYKHVLPFHNAGDYYIIPREQWNENCIPLYLWLPEKSNEPRYCMDDEEDE